MNLQAIAVSAFNAAAAVTDSIWLDATYQQAGTVAYNTTSGTVTPNTGSSAVRVLFGKYKADDKGALREGECRLLMKRAALGATVPAQSDQVVQGGTAWEVVRIEDNPTESHWSMIVKRLQK